MDDLDKILIDSFSVAIEAMFETDSFDKATQIAFENLIEKERAA
jgi:hypothetical protein